MKVGFYLTNRKLKDVDCSILDKGNPGIGGSQYAMLMTCYLLSRQSGSDQFFLFAESVEKLPSDIKAIQIDSLSNLASEIEHLDIDILVVNKMSKETADKSFFDALSCTDVKIIIWAHCFIPLNELNYYSSNRKVSRIVAVSHEEMMIWVDHPIFNKASFIHNICNYPDLEIPSFGDRGNNVVYIGCITKLKGLHLLTKAWPKIIKSIPDAHLYVIGSGNLYNRNTELGKYGIAEYFYEKEVLKPILNADGKIDRSVTFCGVMGEDKFEILKNAKVGVPNPSGLTETFGYTAIEMQLAGALVTTMKCPGYIETVYSEDNILYDNPSNLADSVISLLQRGSYDPGKSINYIRSTFSNERIVKEWIKLLNDVYDDRQPIIKELHSILSSNQRRIKNKKLQKYLPSLPPIMAYEERIEKLKYFLVKLIELPTTLHKIYRRKIR